MKQKKAEKNKHSDLMIVGLGNPGSAYIQTRHNVGFDFVELLSRQLNLFLRKPFFKNFLYARVKSCGKTIHFVKPLTYMNRSGNILPYLMKKYSLEAENLIIVTDNMDLPPGRSRMKPRGSSAGHNGLKSVMANLDTGDFYRLYIGIGRPQKGNSVVDHVLGVFSEEDRRAVDASLQESSTVLLNMKDFTMERILNAVNGLKSGST